jgi:hypothetical protein
VIFWTRAACLTFAAALLASLAAEHFFGVSNLNAVEAFLWPLLLASICLDVFFRTRDGKGREVRNG